MFALRSRSADANLNINAQQAIAISEDVMTNAPHLLI